MIRSAVFLCIIVVPIFFNFVALVLCSTGLHIVPGEELLYSYCIHNQDSK